MGSAKFTFKRYEKKYLLSREKYESLRQLLDPHIVPDEYFESTVCSIYYDSDDYHLIRYSIERPVYKEKLRLRSYNVPGDGDSVFVELKTEKGQLSALQKIQIGRLRDLGQQVEVVRGIRGVARFFEDLGYLDAASFVSTRYNL